MPHSADDESPAPAEVSDSDIDEEEEDPEMLEEEKEEEEEEEEEDEEEEEEEEENMEEEEVREERVEVDMDISDSPIQAHDHHNDVRQHKSDGLDGHLCNSEVVDSKVTNSSSVAGEEMVNAIPMRDRSGMEVKSVMCSEDEVKQLETQPRNDTKQMDSRSAASEIRTRTMSPVAGTSDRNKRPAIVCDFFVKGWCIRGSSCRFVHVKDNPNRSHPQPEGDVAAASCTREVQLDEGLRDTAERSRSPGFPDSLTSSSGSSFAFSSHICSEKIQLSEHIGIQRQHQFHGKLKFPSIQGEEANVHNSTDAHQLYPSKDDPGFLSSLKDVGRDGQTRNWSTDDYNNSPFNIGNSILKNGLHPEPGIFSNGSIMSSGKYSIGKPSSYSSSMEEPARMRSQRVHSDHTSPRVSLSLNTSTSNLLTSGLFPTSRISSWAGFSLPYSYMDCTREYRSSTRSSPFLKSSSPFSSSELKNLPSSSVALHSAELKTKISSNDWEPSVPFRPSFILPPAFLSSSGSQYDPLRDSIELPKLANIYFEASYSEGATIGNRLHQKIHGESVSGTTRPAYDGDTNSMSSHTTYHEKVLGNSCYTREHNSPVTEAETVGTSIVCQNRTMTVEENPLGPSHLKGSTKLDQVSDYGESDSSRHKKDINVDRFRVNNEVNSEHLTVGDVQQETKALRNFHSALVDLVKELLKPKWREGHLSKDAHNKIVKKAVEKVLGTFQPHQIPPTVETVMHYLSSCRPKISKLVEGYVEKYGKS